MKKRFTLLFAALLAFVGVAKADFQLTYSRDADFWGSTLTETEYPTEIAGLLTSESFTSAAVRCHDEAVVVTGDVTVVFEHVNGKGDHKQHILGVVLKNAEGVVKADYHYGTHPGTNNTYTLSEVEAGEYTLSMYVSNNGTDNVNNFGGTITVTGAKIPAASGVVTSAADLDNSKVYTVTANENRGSWYYSPEQNALTSTYKANIAVDATDLKQQFAFLTVDSKVYVYNAFAEKFVIKNGNYTTFVDYPEAYVTLEVSGNANFPVVVALNGANHVGVSNNYTPGVITFHNDLNDGGNQVKLVAVEGTFDNSAALAKLAKGLAAERNALLATAKSANELYATIEDKTLEVVVALKTQVDAAVAAANADDATTETLSAANASLVAAIAACEPLVYNLLEEFDLSTQLFCLKLANANLYMTVVEAESRNDDAGGVQVKGWAEKSVKQVYSFAAVEGEAGKYKIKSSEGYYLTTFGRWGSKATATDSDGAIHEIVYVGEGKYTFKTAKGFVGPNNATDGQYLYSNHGADKANIYWTLEPITASWLTYALTDALGNEYTGNYLGVVGEDMPVLSGAAGCTFSDVEWNGTAVTAKVAFPFPISNAETTNATMISNFNKGQRWHAVGDDVKVQTAQPTNATKGEWLWAIYPKFENGAFTFTVKNVGNGKFVTLNKEGNSFDTQGTVTLTETGTALEVVNWLDAPCFKVPGKTLYLTINGEADSDVYLATYTGGNNNHSGNKVHFTKFVEAETVTLSATEVTLNPKENTVQLTAAVAPEETMDKTVTWSTSAEAVATVDANGLVTAVADGEATITATVGDKTAECVVKVDFVSYATAEEKETFTTQAEAFAALGVGEALSVLKAIKTQWETVNSAAQALYTQVKNDDLVLKADVEKAMTDMQGVQMYVDFYNENCAAAVTEAQGFLEQLKEGSDYTKLAAVMAKFDNVTTGEGLFGVMDELKQVVNELCDIDAKEVTVGTDWIDANTAGRYPIIENADLTEEWDGEPDMWGSANLTSYDADNGVVEFVATADQFVPDEFEELNNEAALRSSADFTEFGAGRYLLTGKAYYKNAVNADVSCGYMYLGNQKFEVPAVAEDVALGEEHEIQYEFTIADGGETYFSVGYICEFENPGDKFVVGGFKIQMIERTETPSLREEFQTAYRRYDMSTMSAAGFANIQYKDYYPAFEAFHPAYEALLAEVDAIYDAMDAGQKVLKAKVAKATEDMKKMEAEMSPVIDYAMSDEYQLTIKSATTTQMPNFMEESNAYKAMDAAVKAAQELSEVTEVAQLQAKVAAINKAIADALAQKPDDITLDKEEAELSDNQRTIQLTATVTAESETADKSIFWVSEDEDVATVDVNGLVTAVAEGEACIIAYSIHKSVYAECYVNVTALTDGIDGFEVKVETVIYDIHGRQIEKMEKGFYIVNGKKVFVK